MQSSNATVQTSDRSRIALFDNIKALLIILVVFGHMMHPVHNDNPVLSGCLDIIYLFHMPMFVLVSGLFAKSTYRDGRLCVDRIILFSSRRCIPGGVAARKRHDVNPYQTS